MEEYPSHVLRGHSDAVLCVALSSVMRLAASGSRDGALLRVEGYGVDWLILATSSCGGITCLAIHIVCLPKVITTD